MQNPPLSRSHSRATLLYFCQKKYYFSYYTKHLGNYEWDFYMESLLLKNLTSLKMRLGSKLHKLMSHYLHALKDDLTWPSEAIKKRLEQQFLKEVDEEYALSKNKDYSAYDKNNKFGLSEHFYGEDIDSLFEEKKQRVLENFRIFCESDFFANLRSEFSQASKIFVEDAKPDFDKMIMTIDRIPELKGIQLWAQPDLWLIIPAQWDKKKTYIIYDWKSGRPRAEASDYISDQLKVYAYKMLLNVGMDHFENIDIYCYEVFFDGLSVFGGKIAWEDIYHIEQKMTLDVINQRQLLLHQNPFKNEPLPSQQFKKTSDEHKCESCRFRKVCTQLQHYEDRLNNQFFNN